MLQVWRLLQREYDRTIPIICVNLRPSAVRIVYSFLRSFASLREIFLFLAALGAWVRWN